MSGSVFALPVSVEQIAATIKQMDQDGQRRLLDLVPDLRRIAIQSFSRTGEQAQAAVARLQKEVLAALDNQPLSPDEPFLGGLTLGQYHALSEKEKNRLWDGCETTDLMQLDEREVNPDALLAG